MTAHWTASFRPARQVHAPFSSTGPRRPHCVHTLTQNRAQARKCGSKRYLGRWAFMTTGPIEQVRRNGYTHIKRRGKRSYYSFVYGTEALHYAKTFAREKRPRDDKRSQRRTGPRQEWDVRHEVFGHKAKGVEAGRRRQKLLVRAAGLRSPEIISKLIIIKCTDWGSKDF